MVEPKHSQTVLEQPEQITEHNTLPLRAGVQKATLTLQAASLPSSLKSVNFMTSAITKPFSKSPWILPAACGAFVPKIYHKK